MLEDMLNRTLTREYLDVLKVLLYGGAENGSGAVNMEEEGQDVKQQYDVISELGMRVLAFDATSQPILLCLLRYISLILIAYSLLFILY